MRFARTLVSNLLFAATLALSAVVSTAAQSQPQAGGQRITLYEGARLIVGNGAPAIEDSAFLVTGGQFTRVARRGEIPLPAGATRVDLTGKTVMPTLVDMHGHFGFQN